MFIVQRLLRCTFAARGPISRDVSKIGIPAAFHVHFAGIV